MKKYISLLTLGLSLPFIGLAEKLTVYTTNYSMYGANYQYDGAYDRDAPAAEMKKVSNPAMVAQFNKADVIAYSFFQVWNSKMPGQPTIPEGWNGLMHFSDTWSELPAEVNWSGSPLPPESKQFIDFCKKAGQAATCSALVGGTVRTYPDISTGLGKMNSFGAFINHQGFGKAKRIIAIGGANTLDNKSISMYSFDAIFKDSPKFLTQLQAFKNTFPGLKGIDYDFEPPIGADGGQLPPDSRTLKDYNDLYNLVVATRSKLGPDFYIAVTITPNKEYLEFINNSVEGGWFKQIAKVADSVNIMTYDLHGPWSKNADPYTALHAFVKQADTLRKSEFAVQYGAQETTEQVLAYGIPSTKLQVGIATYGRGYSGVERGKSDANDQQHPGLVNNHICQLANNPTPGGECIGFEQIWDRASSFPDSEAGLLAYKKIANLPISDNYGIYHVTGLGADNQLSILSSYVYSPSTKQFIGYQSPETVQSLCKLVQTKGLEGAILWSVETDLPVSDSKSLIATYTAPSNCGT